MKQLYYRQVYQKIYYKYDKKGKKIKEVSDRAYSILHYGKIPADTKYEYINFSELSIPIYECKGKKYLSGYYRNDFLGCNISETDFVKYIVEIKYVPVNDSAFSLMELMKQLKASDMIEYLKDRGMKTCPMMWGDKNGLAWKKILHS